MAVTETLDAPADVATQPSGTEEAPPEDDASIPRHAMRTWRFYSILVSLSMAGLLSAIEGTIITSALPTISEALGGGEAYIWVPNAFLLAQVATLPLWAQASNIFGRRNLILIAVALFTFGSGLSGGATSMTMLIAARTVQGVGGGGINLLMETVVTDIVPLRERGKYMALVQLGSMAGASLGPFLGGIITDKSTWRWCFYINVPIGAVTFMALFIFLRVSYRREQGWRKRLARVDFSGNAIFIAAVVGVLIGLTWGGSVYTWQSYHVVVPLAIGFVGLVAFTAFEWTPRICPEPSFPKEIVSNRTSAAALLLTLVHAIVTFWCYYFLPIYFQGVMAKSPLDSGVDTLPTFAGGLLCAVLGGVLMSKLGRYKPIHFFGFSLLTISFGLFSLLDAKSSPAAWVFFQLIAAAGSGLIISVLLPAVQAPLDEAHVATATGLYSFARYFGCVWGVAIPSAIFNNECRRYATTLTDRSIANDLMGGRAYQYATRDFLHGISNLRTRDEVILVFTKSMQTVWLVAIGFAGFGVLVTFLEKEINLRSELNTEFGMETNKKNESAPTTETLTLSAVPGVPGAMEMAVGSS